MKSVIADKCFKTRGVIIIDIIIITIKICDIPGSNRFFIEANSNTTIQNSQN
ncbi:hypothetical protein HOG21_07045 [bacterium]|nr:hypothetical protein [bacterium]